MRVELLGHTPDPETTVAVAARACYSDRGGDDLARSLGPGETSRLISMLGRAGHLSPFEHASFTFYVEGISRVTSHQLVRHRIASYSQRSQRYVTDLGEGVEPPTVARNPDAHTVFARTLQSTAAAYRRLLALGVPQEDARYVLPGASATSLMITMNARSLRHFFALRLCSRAQWEIRELAQAMLARCLAVAPRLFEGAGPSCQAHGICYEGELSCGRAKTVLGRAVNRLAKE